MSTSQKGGDALRLGSKGKHGVTCNESERSVCVRPVDMGVILDTRVYGRRMGVQNTPLLTGRVNGTWTRLVNTEYGPINLLPITIYLKSALRFSGSSVLPAYPGFIVMKMPTEGDSEMSSDKKLKTDFFCRTASWMHFTWTATTDRTSTDIRLNSSKHPHEPDCARPL